MSGTDTTSELRQIPEIIEKVYALAKQGKDCTEPAIRDMYALLAAQKQRWERVAVLRAERNLLSSQISRHLFMDYAEQGAIDRINKIDAELAALDGVIGEL